MNEKRLRLDFVIAMCALLISTVTALAAVYQSRVVAQQFSATVWPYVSFDVTNSPTSVELDLRNDGLGPAIVRWVSITWDGKPEPSIEAVIDELRRSRASQDATARARQSHLRVRITTSTPEVGLVIPANAERPVARIEGSAVATRFRPALRRLEVSLCYCSLTRNCWMQSFGNRSGEPRSVAACPRDKGESG